ncbi:MAG: hypothetical protein ABI239_03920 [Aquihabitans sp.]
MGTKKRALSSVVVALASLLLVATGCGKAADKLSEKATEKAIESAAGEGVDVDLDGDGNFAIETEDGSYSAQVGKVPASWPDDVPLPPDLTVVQSGTEMADAEGITTTSVSFTTNATASAVAEFYTDALSDWTDTMNSTSSADSGDFSQLMYEKGDRTVVIIAASSEGETQVTINHTEAPAQ